MASLIGTSGALSVGMGGASVCTSHGMLDNFNRTRSPTSIVNVGVPASWGPTSSGLDILADEDMPVADRPNDEIPIWSVDGGNLAVQWTSASGGQTSPTTYVTSSAWPWASAGQWVMTARIKSQFGFSGNFFFGDAFGDANEYGYVVFSSGHTTINFGNGHVFRLPVRWASGVWLLVRMQVNIPQGWCRAVQWLDGDPQPALWDVGIATQAGRGYIESSISATGGFQNFKTTSVPPLPGDSFAFGQVGSVAGQPPELMDYIQVVSQSTTGGSGGGGVVPCGVTDFGVPITPVAGTWGPSDYGPAWQQYNGPSVGATPGLAYSRTAAGGVVLVTDSSAASGSIDLPLPVGLTEFTVTCLVSAYAASDILFYLNATTPGYNSNYWVRVRTDSVPNALRLGDGGTAVDGAHTFDGTPFFLKYSIDLSGSRAKVWSQSDPEPGWLVSLPAGDRVGLDPYAVSIEGDPALHNGTTYTISDLVVTDVSGGVLNHCYGSGLCGITDSFGRIVTGGLGASDAGFLWTTSDPTVPSVDGTEMVATVGSATSSSLDSTLTTNSTFLNPITEVIAGTIDFWVDNIGTDTGALVQLGFGGRCIFGAKMGLTGVVRLQYNFSVSELAKTDWVASTWYRMRFLYDKTGGQHAIKVWPRDTAEPAGWTFTRSNASDSLTGLNANVLLTTGRTVGTSDPTVIKIDNLDLSRGGVAVNNCSVAAACGITDTFARTVVAGWGTSDSGIAWLASGSLFSVNGTRGLITLNSTSQGPTAFWPTITGLPVEFYIDVTLSNLPTGSPEPRLGIDVGGDNTSLSIALFVALGVVDIEAGDFGPNAEATGQDFTVPLRIHVLKEVIGSDTHVSANIWPVGSPEPAGWLVTDQKSLTVDTTTAVGFQLTQTSVNTGFTASFANFDLLGVNGCTRTLPADLFDRTVSGGFGTGGLGTWVTKSSTYDSYLSVNGTFGIVNQVAPLASGDITLGVDTPFVNVNTGPVEVLFEWAQVGVRDEGGGRYFINPVLYIADARDLSGEFIGVEFFNSPGTQYTSLFVGVSGSGGLPTGTEVDGSYTLPGITSGDINYTRLRVDGTGAYARVWAKGTTEPTSWTSTYVWSPPPSWTPTCIVMQPRQTSSSGTGTQEMWLDQITVTAGSTL